MHKVDGYLVLHKGDLMHLGENYMGPESSHALWIGDSATVFKSRREAKEAIALTISDRMAWLKTLENRTRPVEEDPFVCPDNYHIVAAIFNK